MNVISISGNVGRDPEVTYSKSGMAIANFSVAVSRKRGDGFTTSWFPVRCFQETADFVRNFVSKGDRVFVVGSMVQDNYKDKNGEDKTYWRLYGNEVYVKPKASEVIASGQQVEDEEIPF